MDLKKEIKTVKIFLDIEEKYGDINSITYQALKLKYEALTTVPTTIQKTMTPAQLYASDSPLWAYKHGKNTRNNPFAKLSRQRGCGQKPSSKTKNTKCVVRWPKNTPTTC